MTDPLLEHYTQTVRLIEHLILSRVPKFPGLKPSGLSVSEREEIAARFVAGHYIADAELHPRKVS